MRNKSTPRAIGCGCCGVLAVLLAGCGSSRSFLSSSSTSMAKATEASGYATDSPQAQTGDVSAEIRLAKDYITGNGCSVDYAAAMSWLNKASSGGSKEAKALVGAMYYHGYGVAKDMAKVKEIEQPLADENVPTAQEYLGLLYEFGAGGLDKNLVKAAQLLQAASANGNSRAMAQLGILYERGDGVKRDPSHAKELFEKATASGDDWGQFNLGETYERGGVVSVSYDTAARYYQLSAAQHNFLAEYRLGLLYQDGKGVPQDYGKAYEWYSEAAKFHYPPAEAALGTLYNLGLGVTADQEKAYAWISLAAQAGYAPALAKLKLLEGITTPADRTNASAEVAAVLAKRSTSVH